MVQIHSPRPLPRSCLYCFSLHSLFPLHLPFQEQRATDVLCTNVYKTKAHPNKRITQEPTN